jgi:L-aspartate oxidase
VEPKEPAGDAPARTAERADLQRRAWAGLGVERDAAGIQAVLDHVLMQPDPARMRPHDRASAEDRNLSAVIGAMARLALAREESRGGHYRRDFPETDDRRFRAHSLLDPDGVRLTDVDVPLEAGARC